MINLQTLVDELEDKAVDNAHYSAGWTELNALKAARKTVENAITNIEEKLKEAAKLADDYMALACQNAGLHEEISELKMKLTKTKQFDSAVNRVGYSAPFYGASTQPCTVTVSSEDFMLGNIYQKVQQT